MRPRVLLSVPRQNVATFFWEDRPDFYVGYRMFEHDPRAADTPLQDVPEPASSSLGDFPSLQRPKLQDADARPLLPNMVTSYVEEDPEQPVQLSFQAFADGTAWCSGLDNKGAQKRELFFKPDDDGVLMWMRLTTEKPIPGPFVVAQCLQFAGDTSMEWMRSHSHAPMFSEFDLQAHWKPNQTLTYARTDRSWFEFPVQWTCLYTARGLPFAQNAKQPPPACDHGLVLRESFNGEYASGMYWERTAFVANRHPADCAHAFVDYGPLAAGESRTVHGKFYLVEGGKNALLEAWRRDFPDNNPRDME